MSKLIAPDETPTGKEVATLGGGCFWCLEAVYDDMKGIESVESGYMGGSVPNPTYEQVCDGSTGHAEVVRITFDPHVATYQDILQVFFVIHDPTTLNRQGNDAGTQYRSVVFHHTAKQREIAEQTIKRLEEAKVWPDPIVTQIAPATDFWVAEDYHQEYFRRNPNQPYCSFVVEPKVQKFRKAFMEKLKK